MRATSRIRAWISVAAAVGVGLLVACVTLEGLLRLDARGWSANVLAPWEEHRPWEAIRRFDADHLPRPIPGGHAAWRLQPWNAPIEYRLDEHGFRVAYGSPGGVSPTAAPACRVLAIGDSHTFGYGVAAEEAWPAVLQSMLLGVRTSNAGICGSGIAASQAFLPAALAAARPQVVVIGVTPWSLREDPEPPEIHEIDARFPRLEAYVRRVTRASALADRLVSATFRWSNATVGWPPPAPVLWELDPLLEPAPRFHARWRTMDARLAAMVRTVRAARATPIVLFVPLDLQVSAARNVLYRTGRLPYRTHGFVDCDYAHDDRYVRALRKTTDRLRVPLVDATPVLRLVAPGGYLPDDYHLAPDGHAHVAGLMAEPIAEACAARTTVVRAALPTDASAPSPRSPAAPLPPDAAPRGDALAPTVLPPSPRAPRGA